MLQTSSSWKFSKVGNALFSLSLFFFNEDLLFWRTEWLWKCGWVFHLLLHSLNACNSHVWMRPGQEPGAPAWSSVWVRGPSVLAGSWIGIRTTGAPISSPMWGVTVNLLHSLAGCDGDRWSQWVQEWNCGSPWGRASPAAGRVGRWCAPCVPASSVKPRNWLRECIHPTFYTFHGPGLC